MVHVGVPSVPPGLVGFSRVTYTSTFRRVLAFERKTCGMRRRLKLRDERGVTAIELVVVVMVVAILALIALPRMSAARARAFVATARADLRNLASFQEIYFSSHGTFSTDTAALRFQGSEGVSVTISDANNDSWSGTATHAAVPETTCEIDVNSIGESEESDNQVICYDTSGTGNSNNGQGNGQGNGSGG